MISSILQHRCKKSTCWLFTTHPGKLKHRRMSLVQVRPADSTMNRLLIAYDGSSGADIAIAELPNAGLPEKLEVEVLTIADVWLPPEPVAPDGPCAKALEALRQARETASAGAREVRQRFPSWAVSHEALAESPAWGILAESRKWSANLIIIGSQGRTRLERFFLGSVSYKVAAEAACSVRVVKPKNRPPGRPLRLLIALDGSDDSQRAVEEVLTRRWLSGTEFDLVTVVDPRIESYIDSQGHGEPNSAESMLQSVAARFQAQSFATHIHRLEGDPKDKMLRVAADKAVDTIFLGARGLHHGERLYLGTTASAVCTRAPCTVEIVRKS